MAADGRLRLAGQRDPDPWYPERQFARPSTEALRLVLESLRLHAAVGCRAGLGAIYRDEVFVATDNAIVLGGLTRFDAAVYYAMRPNIQAQLNIENLFDQTYFASAHSNNNILPGSPCAIRLGVGFAF